MRLIRWVLGVVLVALAGCAIHPERDEGVTMVAPDAAARWVLDGRIGVQGGPQAIQASLIWEHDARQERLRLSGPLSQGLVSVVAQGDVLLINEGEGAQTVYRNPDQALRERLGVPVPLVSLKYWVLGIPDPAAESKHPNTRAFTAPSLEMIRGNTRSERTIPTDGAAPAMPNIQLGCPHASNVNAASG